MRTLSFSKLTNLNQLTIPDWARQRLGLKAGDSVAFKLRDGLVYLQKAKPVDQVKSRPLGKIPLDEWNSTQDERAYSDL